MSKKEEKKDEVFLALSHPIRRQILEEIYIQGSVSYTYLVELTHLKPGPLYHHLKKIKKFVYQTDDKQYRLSEEGYRALEILKALENKEYRPISSESQEELKIINFFGLSFSPLVKFFSKNPYRTMTEFVILALLCAYFASESDILLIGTFVVGKEIPLYLSFLSILSSWFIIAGLIELIVRLLLKNKEQFLKLLSAITLCFLPIFLFFLIIWLVGYFISTGVKLSLYPLLIFHGFFQLWSFFIVSTTLGELKEISLEKSAIIALAINYIQIMVVIFVII